MEAFSGSCSGQQQVIWRSVFVVLLLTHILGFQDVIVFRDLFFTLL